MYVFLYAFNILYISYNYRVVHLQRSFAHLNMKLRFKFMMDNYDAKILRFYHFPCAVPSACY